MMDSLLRETSSSSVTAETRTSPAFQLRGKPAFAVQKTLRQPISASGTGLHTGQAIRLVLQPAPAGHGIVFQRTDLADAAPLPARYDSVVETRLSTVLGDSTRSENRVATIEHLMAAFHGCGIDNARVLVDGPEIPVFDGSAADFVFLLDCAGTVAQGAPRRMIEVLKPVRVEQGDAFVELLPASDGKLHLSLSIDFAARAIGHQSCTLDLNSRTFRDQLARSRTFTLRAEIEALHKAGLARGGSLDNAVVVDDDQVLNPGGLRCPDEFIRHKVMDAVGDLYLAGGPLTAHLRGHRSGHGLNNQVLRKLFADPTAWGYASERQAIVAAA